MFDTDVCFMLPGFSPRPVGGYKIVYSYANALARAGKKVSILHHRNGQDDPRFVALLRSVALRIAYTIGHRTRPTWGDLEPAVRVINSYGTWRPPAGTSPRVVVTTSVGTVRPGYDWARSTGAKCVNLIQGVETFVANENQVDAALRVPCRKLAISPSIQRWLHGKGIEAGLIVNGVDRSIFRTGVPAHLRDRHVLAMVSRDSWKRTDLVVSLFNRLYQLDPTVKLTTFGTVDRVSGLPDCVTHVRSPGPEDLAALYRRARLYVCVSDTEGFGLTVAEAVCCGARVVSTKNGGVESFASSVAELVEVGNLEALVSAVRNQLTDQEVAGEMESRSALSEALSADRMAQEVIAYFDELLT